MKSPLGSIVEAGNTADGDANANMITSRSAGSDLSDNLSNQQNNNESSEANSQADTRKRALDEARMVLTALNAAPQKKEIKQEMEAVKPPPPPPGDTPDLSKATPKTRSDAVAAAKRRAEERRKSSATSTSKHGSPNKPTAAATTTTNETILSNTNETNSMDWFNLLGPVANPSGIDLPRDLYNYSSSAHTSSHSSHRRPSRHGSGHNNSISNDHIGSSPTESYATSLLNAAGMQDLASYASYAESTTSVAMESMTKNLDDITGWFDHYSRKYLGTLPGIDGALDNEADGNDGGLVSNLRRGRDQVIWEEYEPEFGPEDVPELQREELPMEIEELDLGSVEEYLRRCGMLGMRFEDRGGGFRVMRERMERRRRGESVDEECYVAASSATNLRGEETIIDVPKAIEVVPDLFFSQYFDLTDPICFEKLLVVSDEEVAEIRAKEAELHALAEQKVKEAEEVAKRDAENGVVAPRPPPRHPHNTDGTDDGMSQLTNLPNQSGASLTKDAHRTKTPVDGNVITLRKPETFTAHLDAIELALLEQVRSKSSSFFRETNRFSELQHLVTASVDEVRSLRTDLQSLRERCVTNVELVPIMDDSRKDLRQISRVLEAAEDVVNCKASIASLMSAGDHLGAVEAIGLARSLLAATPDGGNEDAAENDANAANGENDSCHLPQHKLCLGKLKALSKVGEQLNEYQKLVVRNLTDELVDTFLSWGTSQSTAGDDAGSGSVDYRAPPRVALSFDRRSKIRGVVQSLRICGQLPGAGVAYQKRLCELISVTVKAIVTECVADAKTTARNGNAEPGAQPRGTMAGVASMSLEQFIDCINMLFEQVLGLLWGAVAVNKFCIEEGLVFDHKINNSGTKTSDSGSENGHSNDNAQHTPSATAAALAAAVDLAEKSVSELLRLRREAHSLVSFDGMRQLWDTSLTFTLQLERFSGRKAYGLRSTLLAQAKSFVERKHEANMSTLAAAMDSERWVQCNVSAERQAALNRLCSGRAAFTSRNANQRNTDSIASPSAVASSREKMADAEVEGNQYKVVWSCLLLLEMIMDDVACAAHFQTLATNVVGKVAELFRLFNTRTTQLVLGAGAIHSAARLKSINAKHLSIVTQCIALILAILPHVRAALMAQLPTKQHALLSDLDKIKTDYSDHNEKILGKLVSIIGGIVEHSLAAKIPQTNFDNVATTSSLSVEAGDENFECSPFIDSVVTNTKKMHQVLNVMLPPELLRDVFSQIFAYLDNKVPSLYKDFAAVKVDPNAPNKPRFIMPTTEVGKRRMVKEVEHMTKTLNCLAGVQPWHFTAMKVLQRELDIEEEEPELPTDKDIQSYGESDEKKETDDAPSSDASVLTQTELTETGDAPSSDASVRPQTEQAETDDAPSSDASVRPQSEQAGPRESPSISEPAALVDHDKPTSSEEAESDDIKEMDSPIETSLDSGHSPEDSSQMKPMMELSEDPSLGADALGADANPLEDNPAGQNADEDDDDI